MDLSHEEVDRYLIDIFNGTKYVMIEGLVFLFMYPSNAVKQLANLVYDKSFEKAKSMGMLPTSELDDLIGKRRIITEEESTKLDKLKSQLEAQQILLSKTHLVKANQDRIKQTISRLRNDIALIEYKKKSKLFMSADSKAEEDKTFFICSKCVFKEDGSLFWNTYEEALKENKLDLRNTIIYEYSKFFSGQNNSIIRAIARSSLWRIRYVSSIKTSEELFGKPLIDYTADQLNLVYWSTYYQNIYEMLPEDRPSDDVINEDELLDEYMKTLYEERTRQDADRKSKANRPGKLSAFDAEEVIVTRSHELYQDIEYDTPKEAKKLKDRVDIRKRAKRG